MGLFWGSDPTLHLIVIKLRIQGPFFSRYFNCPKFVQMEVLIIELLALTHSVSDQSIKRKAPL
jgi:hypothetical protein